MFKNLNQNDFNQFKSTYRLKIYKSKPIDNLSIAVNLAYLDVNRTLRGIKYHLKQSESIKDSTIEFLDDILNNSIKNQDLFDEIHDEYCQKIMCSDGVKVHYGQAQKILNMSLKYAYNEYSIFGKMLNFKINDNVEDFFHLPVDSIIIAYLVKYHRFTVNNIPWSKWDKNIYYDFQKQLRSKLVNNCKTLEVDFLAWNSSANSTKNYIT